MVNKSTGHRGSAVVKVLCYKSEGRWFDSRWCHRISHWHNPSDRTMALAQKLVPGSFPGGKGGRCVGLTTHHHPVPLSRNLGTLAPWNPLGLCRPVTGLLYLYLNKCTNIVTERNKLMNATCYRVTVLKNGAYTILPFTFLPTLTTHA